ncbi:hypothetical protein CVA01_25420 [Corynebacterium variabile]|uniref:Uncharacterized protein n=1 Tax=Corynebacterium variabile TaxID=1727 RepID=A0A4Y4C3E0_9CORY|nr:hypothetical protein CVA01_25420 [Corynebacterium variabile]
MYPTQKPPATRAYSMPSGSRSAPPIADSAPRTAIPAVAKPTHTRSRRFLEVSAEKTRGPVNSRATAADSGMRPIAA